ncbi:MAG: hypothetical protein HC904_01655 [Blastochloris sp.]|nr:hypothetical protein [Blastochloris sp.]
MNESVALKHSGLGICSFIVSLASAVLMFALFVVAGVMESATPGGIDEKAPATVVLGLFIIGALMLELVALIFGIVTLFQKDRKKLFGILGVVFSGAVILLTLGLMVLGLSMG